MQFSVELSSAVLSFLGGLFLSVDALRAQSRIRAESGAARLLEIMKAHHTGGQLKDAGGAALSSEEAIRLWFAKQSSPWVRWGFVLMTIGFVLQIVAALSGPTS